MLSVVLASGSAEAGTDPLTISGTVRTDEGAPAPGIRVVYEGGSGFTDSSGSFSFPTYPGWAKNLVVHPVRSGVPGLPSKFRVVWPDAMLSGDEPVNITLPPAVRQEFQVVDADGIPAASGYVEDATDSWERAPSAGSASSLGAGNVFQKISRVETGATGLVFADPRYNGLQVRGTPKVPEGWGTTLLWQRVSGVELGAADPATVMLPRTGKVRGRVQTADGVELPSNIAFYDQNGAFAQANSSTIGTYRFLAPLGVTGVLSADGVLGSASGAGALGYVRWSTGGFYSPVVHGNSDWDFILPPLAQTQIRVSQGGAPAEGAQVAGRQYAVQTQVGQNQTTPVTSWVETTADAQGVATLRSFAQQELTGLNVGLSRTNGESYWQANNHLRSVIPGTPGLSVRLPAITHIVGDVRFPDSWGTPEINSYSQATAVDGRVSAWSRGHSLNLPVDGRGSRIRFAASPNGDHAPVSFYTKTHFAGDRTRSNLVAPDTVTLRVRTVNHRGNPVSGVMVGTPGFDRALPARFFTGLDESTVFQSLLGFTDSYGKALVGAFPDRRVAEIEVTTPSGRTTSVYDVKLTTDGRLSIEIDRHGNPVVK